MRLCRVIAGSMENWIHCRSTMNVDWWCWQRKGMKRPANGVLAVVVKDTVGRGQQEAAAKGTQRC